MQPAFRRPCPRFKMCSRNDVKAAESWVVFAGKFRHMDADLCDPKQWAGRL